MGLTKQYRRFVAGGSFGLVGSPRGGVLMVPGRSDRCVASAAEWVNVWNLRTGEKAGEVGRGESQHEVTALEVAQAAGGAPTLAVGYHDGAVRIFNLDTGKP